MRLGVVFPQLEIGNDPIAIRDYAQAASLTIYDMAKSADKAIRIGPIQLERKSGGRSGDFVRSTDS
ncbi:MAG: hypothetical protein IIC02_13060 [Planctomycetes bacterium]|nr:hypothetical protein [Planctomycetota bacterium]